MLNGHGLRLLLGKMVFFNHASSNRAIFFTPTLPIRGVFFLAVFGGGRPFKAVKRDCKTASPPLFS
jgi:hypothetical protein